MAVALTNLKKARPITNCFQIIYIQKKENLKNMKIFSAHKLKFMTSGIQSKSAKHTKKI